MSRAHHTVIFTLQVTFPCCGTGCILRHADTQLHSFAEMACPKCHREYQLSAALMLMDGQPGEVKLITGGIVNGDREASHS